MTENVLDFESLMAFLPVIRRPQDFYVKVDESCAIGDNELRRRLDIQISDKARSLRHLIIDLMHPDKGQVMNVRVLSDPQAVTILGHDEHLRIVRSLIVTRLNGLLRSMSIPDESEGPFVSEWEQVFTSLTALPNLSPDRAAFLLSKHFDSEGKLRILSKFPEITASDINGRGLHTLCKRVARKYFLLIKVDVNQMSSSTLSFEYRHEVTEHIFDSKESRNGETPSPTPGRTPSFPDRGPATGRRSKHGVAPVAFRVHVPWAKRSNNYTFSMDSPPGHFIAYEELLEKPRFSYPRIVQASNSSHLGYSISNEQGRRIRLFVREGRKNKVPIYLAVRHDELPSRTTSKAFLIAWSVLIGIILFSIGSMVFTGDQSNAAGLVCAALALGVFVSTPPVGPGVLGHPRLPRVSVISLTIITAGFSLWLTGRKLTWAKGRAIPDEAVDYLNIVWPQVNSLLWVPFALAAAIVTLLLGNRRRKLREHFSYTISSGPKFSENFFG